MRQRPLLVWAAAFAAGIGLGTLGWLTPTVAFGLAACGLAVLVWSRSVPFFLAGLLLLGLCAGSLRLSAFETLSPSDISHWADTPAPVTLTGTVISDPESRRAGRQTLFLRGEALQTHGQTTLVTGDVSVTLGPDAAQGQSLDFGDRVRLEGMLTTPLPATNPGAFSWRDYLARRAVYCELRVKRRGAVEELGPSHLNPLLHLAVWVRRRVLNALHQDLPPTEAAVLAGILIGHRTDLPPDLMADFIHTGTVHILASAGLHVGILAFWLEKLFQKLTLPRKAQAAMLIFCLILYALICGGRPSVTRAVIMAALYFGAIFFEREPDLPTALGAASLLILLIQPTALLEPGFQLSFLTILTLSLTMPLWDKFWRGFTETRIRAPVARKAVLWALEGIGLSCLAQLGALPIVSASYNEVSLGGWLANILVVPALFVLIPLGFAGVLLGSVCHLAGLWLLLGAGWGIEWVLTVVHGFGSSAWAYRAIPPPSVAWIFGYYAALGWGVWVYSKSPQPPIMGE
jgi:competence protein ComEC